MAKPDLATVTPTADVNLPATPPLQSPPNIPDGSLFPTSAGEYRRGVYNGIVQYQTTKEQAERIDGDALTQKRLRRVLADLDFLLREG